MNSNTGVVIYVSANVPPEAKENFARNLMDITHAARQVAGCLTYQWFVNPGDSNNYIIYGEFDSEENFLLYKRSDVVANIGKLLLPLLTEKPGFKHFRARVFEQG